MTCEFVDGRYPTGNSEHGRPAVEANARLLDVAPLDDVIAYLRAVKGAVPSSVSAKTWS